jgi:hypothetical protein
MNNSPYYNAFKSKTDLELTEILNNSDQYAESASETALEILISRNGKTEELAIISDKLKSRSNERHQDSIEQKNLTEDPNAPEFHSKKVLFLFSVLFAPVFAAVLLMFNLEQIDNKSGKKQVLAFAILYPIISVIILYQFGFNKWLSIIFHLIGAGIITEYFWDKHIGENQKYRKRSWIKPAIVSIIISAIMGAVVFLMVDLLME